MYKKVEVPCGLALIDPRESIASQLSKDGPVLSLPLLKKNGKYLWSSFGPPREARHRILPTQNSLQCIYIQCHFSISLRTQILPNARHVINMSRLLIDYK